MFRRIILPALIISLVVYLFISTSCQKPLPAEKIFYNGKIFTAKSPSDFVTAFAVKNGKIIATGRDNKILEQFSSDSTEIVDLNGKFVVPGFHDAHLHFWNGAKLRNQVNLTGITSLDSVIQILKTAAANSTPGSWIIGRGWDHELWKDKKLPDRRILDRISQNHLFYLKRVDGHAAWVNTPVLRVLRYNRYTPNPPGGEILKNSSGEPTGILLDTAFDILDNIIPEPTFTQKYDFVRNALKYAGSLGITSITDNSPISIYEVYTELLRKHELTLRINFWIDYKESLDSLRSRINKAGVFDEFLSAPLIKVYADGSLGSRSAYLTEPYLDNPGNIGLPRFSTEDLIQKIQNIEMSGFQVGIHAIGDAAVRQVLEAYEKTEPPNNKVRRRIEHAQIVDSSDFNKFKKLNVIASMQPSHCITDMHWAGRRIGERTRFSYAWRTFLDNEVMLAFGTDWPVEPLNPMIGLYAAVTRKDTTGFPENGWHSEERIGIGEAIRAYTYGSAYAAGNDNWCGTLQTGRVADFVVLDQDLFRIPRHRILKTRVLSTYLNGEKIYQRSRKSLQK